MLPHGSPDRLRVDVPGLEGGHELRRLDVDDRHVARVDAVLDQDSERVALGAGAAGQPDPLARKSADVSLADPRIRPGDDGDVVGVVVARRIAVQMADQKEREPVRYPGEERDGAHHVHVLSVVEQTVDHLDPGRILDHLRVESMIGEDAALHPHEHRCVVGRGRRADPDLQRVGLNGGRKSGGEGEGDRPGSHLISHGESPLFAFTMKELLVTAVRRGSPESPSRAIVWGGPIRVNRAPVQSGRRIRKVSGQARRLARPEPARGRRDAPLHPVRPDPGRAGHAGTVRGHQGVA